MDKVKVAVVGAGALANAMHYPSLAGFDDVEIVGTCDLVSERLNATAERFGIANRYTDYHAHAHTYHYTNYHAYGNQHA